MTSTRTDRPSHRSFSGLPAIILCAGLVIGVLNLTGVAASPEALKQLRQQLLGCRIVRL